METGNTAPDDKDYAALLDAQCGHGTCLSAVQPGIKVQPLALLQFLHGTANYRIAGSLSQHPSPVNIVGQVTSMHLIVASIPWPSPMLVSTI